MGFEGVVRNGVVVPDNAESLPEGMRVTITPVNAKEQPTFGELFGDLSVDSEELPADLASQHEHYRLGKPKR